MCEPAIEHHSLKSLVHNRKDIKESNHTKSYCYKFKVSKSLRFFYLSFIVSFFYSDALLL